MECDVLIQELSKQKARQQLVQEELLELEKSMSDIKKELKDIEEAQKIIQVVAQETQNTIKYHITDIVNTALQAVFDNPYEFRLDFVLARNNSEADMYFIRDDNRIDPMTESGGGAVDIAAFALLISALTMLRTTKTLILDEPFRFLSEDLQSQGCAIMKQLSETLGIQFIVVTHRTELIDVADKVFYVKQNKGISKVEESI